MPSDPLVTIVTPSLNQREFLEETLHSVRRQDYPRIEHIVIDGGSTDGSVEIIRRHEAQLALWISEPDTGQSNAINKGFAKATGSIFAWLNSDDLLAPSAVRIAVDRLQREPAAGLVFGDRVQLDAKGNVTGFVRCPEFYPAMLRRNITIPQETAFFRRELFDRVGGLDESLHFAMDFDLWCKMAAVAPVRHVPAFLGCYRAHSASKSVAFHGVEGKDKFRDEVERVYRRHFNRGPAGPWAGGRYRLLHQWRTARERRSAEYAREVARIRRLVESGVPSADAQTASTPASAELGGR